MSENLSNRIKKVHGGHAAPTLTAQMRENAVWRLWLFSLLSFVMLLSYPLMTALRLHRYARNDMASLIMRQGLGHNAVGLTGGMTVLLMTVCGVLCAFEGFSWIYSRRRVDMYLCQPITRGRRFFIHYFNGILLCFIPYTVSLLLTLLVMAGEGVASPAHLVNVLFSVPAALIYFLAVYNLTLIAMMISGKKGMAGLFALMGFLYDPLLRGLLESYCSSYFSTYAGIVESRQFISPIWRMLNELEQTSFSWGTEAVTVGGLVEKLIRPMLPGMFVLLAEAVVFGGIAYACYQKRPMEAVGQAVAFRSVKGPVKALLMVAAGLYSSACFREISGNDGYFVSVCGLVLGMLFCQALTEIVYEGDLKAFSGHRRAFAAGAVVTVFVYLFFALDLSGYDTWVPAQDEVESAAIVFYFENRYCTSYVYKDGEPGWDERYPLGVMKVTDVSAILSLAADGMGKDAGEPNPDTKLQCGVKYYLKNGTEKYRNFYIDYEREKTVLDILFANEDYKEGANQVLSEQMDQIFERSSMYYSNGLQEKEIVDKSTLPLMQAYREDLREMSFSDVKDALPCGVIRLRYRTDDREEYMLEYPVFSSFARTVEYLCAKDIELYLKIDPEAVEGIEVVRYTDGEPEFTEDRTFFGTSVTTVQTEKAAGQEYTKKEQISEILGYIYPTSLTVWAYLPGITEEDISVTVREADNTAAWQYHWNESFAVKRGELPEFVMRDIGSGQSGEK